MRPRRLATADRSSVLFALARGNARGTKIRFRIERIVGQRDKFLIRFYWRCVPFRLCEECLADNRLPLTGLAGSANTIVWYPPRFGGRSHPRTLARSSMCRVRTDFFEWPLRRLALPSIRSPSRCSSSSALMRSDSAFFLSSNRRPWQKLHSDRGRQATGPEVLSRSPCDDSDLSIIMASGPHPVSTGQVA